MSLRCRVGFAEDFLLADGRLSFPAYDLGGLPADPGVEVVRVPAGPRHRAGDLHDIDVLVSVPNTAALGADGLEGASRLLGVVRVGVGCDDVDLAACTEEGVAIVVPAEAVRRPTAVAALTLILALATRLVEKDRLSREGPAAWGRRPDLRGSNLEGRTLGLLGCGSIGSDLARLAQPLGLAVLAFDPALGEAEARDMGVLRTDLAGLLAAADILSIHCPLDARTRHLLDARAMARMKRGAWLINTARGGIVDQGALAAALRSGQLGGAGLDVFDPEPLAVDDALLHAPNVVLGAHALNWTEELDRDLAVANMAAVMDLLEGRTPRKVVNAAVLERPAFRRRQAALAARLAAARAAQPLEGLTA